MPFKNFELEQFQSQFERTVDYNLADSSVQCTDVRELLQAGVHFKRSASLRAGLRQQRN